METMQLSLTSPAITDRGRIPRKYTCEGDDISPPLSWSGTPEGTKSFVLIIDDPDAPDPAAPRMTWVHWVLYNLPSAVRELLEGILGEALPPGTREGQNNWRNLGYGGPCPPIGRHRYFHKLYALDVVLPNWVQQPNKNWKKPCRITYWPKQYLSEHTRKGAEAYF